MWPQWPPALGSLQSTPHQCGHMRTYRASRWCQGQSTSSQKCRALWYTGEAGGGPRGRGAPWCWQCWRGWPPSPSHMPSLSRLSQLRTGGHPCPLPTPTQASPNPREAPIFFGCAGFSLWGIGSSCGRWAFSSCGKQAYSLAVVHRLLIAVASLVMEHGL